MQDKSTLLKKSSKNGFKNGTVHMTVVCLWSTGLTITGKPKREAGLAENVHASNVSHKTPNDSTQFLPAKIVLIHTASSSEAPHYLESHQLMPEPVQPRWKDQINTYHKYSDGFV